MTTVPATFIGRWRRFVIERFPLRSHVLMTGAFFAGNVAVTHSITGGQVRIAPMILGYIATLQIFFRMRIFDDIKDYSVDRKANRDRPLARHLISCREALTVAALVAALEMALALVCGAQAFLAWSVVLVASLLRYREFFIGPWLRPKMELYAVTHTLIAGWIGLFIAAAISQRHLWHLPSELWWFVLANWAVFNVFEFARKTWAREEEHAEIESYSNRLYPTGAVLLTLSQVLIAVFLTTYLFKESLAALGSTWVVVAQILIPCLASSVFICRTTRRGAQAFRGAMQSFIITFYVVLVACYLYGSQKL